MWLNGVWLNAEAHKAHHSFHDHWMSQSPTPAFHRFVLIHLYFLPLRQLLFLQSSCCQSAQCLPVSHTPKEVRMKCLLSVNWYLRCIIYCIHSVGSIAIYTDKKNKPQKCNWSAVQMSLSHFRTLPTLLHVYSLQNKKPIQIEFHLRLSIILFFSTKSSLSLNIPLSFSLPKISESSMVITVFWSFSVNRTSNEFPRRDPKKMYSSKHTHIWNRIQWYTFSLPYETIPMEKICFICIRSKSTYANWHLYQS